ncbi:putative endonuclease lcl3 [Ceratobasidium sp. 428]|nr:putative endonuclease lcl3 [Ceratobasidium sp. 428]
MPESRPVSKQFKELTALYSSDPRAQALVLWTAGLTSLVGVTGLLFISRAVRSFRRIPNADWVDPGILSTRPLLRGVVTRVGDGDNFRFYHTPGLFWHWPLRLRRVPAVAKDLTNETLHIRINAVDAPEAAHFGREAQPHSAEAIEWLKKQILGKTVFCRPLRKDHHGRIVRMTPVLSPAERMTCRY